jgi:carboxypeptidase family protein
VKENSKPSNRRKNMLGVAWLLLCALMVALGLPLASHAQDTGYISGTVTDKSGAAVAGAEVLINNLGGSLTRTTTTNTDGAYVVAGLPGGVYNLVITAKGFQKYSATKVVLAVAQKIRIDVQLIVGGVTEVVEVTGESVAQVETTSSDLSGTVTGKQIAQLQLNGRNFTQLATIVPGVSNQTGQDEGQVGVYGSVAFSFNGGRTEYNNWELDGGDNMDNGSNGTLNVYPSIDAIAEVKVLTSNYGAQYGRNASGTVEVETKSGTNKFHGDVYYFGRNDALNARDFFEDKTQPTPKFKKHDFGYTVGGPVFIPGHYNSKKDKTFFFFSEEWRRNLVPGQTFNQGLPSVAERGGDFSDVCPNLSPAPGAGPMDDCPTDPRTGNKFNLAATGPLPVDPNAKAMLAMIPAPTSTPTLTVPTSCGQGIVACFNSSPSQTEHWREELVRIDHNFSSNLRATFRYIHDSWSTGTPTTLWAADCPDGCSFPTIQTGFVGPGTSFVTRLNATISPTLLNEFVASYTADHIFLTNTGPGAVSRSSISPALTMTGLFPNFGDKLTGFLAKGNASYGTFEEGPSFIPWNNANPTYTFRDNVTKVAGRHTLLFGAYVAIAQKNEQSSVGVVQGFLTFDASNSQVSSGNSFADLLLGNIDNFQQASAAPKYYFRYQIVEPYFQDDWRITPHLTLNLGLRVSLFGTYRDKYKQAFDFEPALFKLSDAPAINPATGALVGGNPFNGVAQCGGKGGAVTLSGFPSAAVAGDSNAGCVRGHLFNPAPRVGFAWDPWGNGKTAVRGGYGIFFEHGNGNEANVEALEATPPLVLIPTQTNIVGGCAANTTGYECIGGTGAPVFPLGFNVIDTRGIWPYAQQWNLNVQHELPQHIVASVAYVGSKGTHLGQKRNFNQWPALPLSQNPFGPGQSLDNTGPIDPGTGQPVGACAGPGGDPNNPTSWNPGQTVVGTNSALTALAAAHLNIACGADPNPNRPFTGFADLAGAVFAANSNYHSFQLGMRRAIAPLVLSVAYTYSHSIDNASDGSIFGGGSFVDANDVHRARASSDFDQRHSVNISYVYDLPFFKGAGLAHNALGGWQLAGVTSIQTGVPFSVVFSGFSDNAGVSNGAGPGTYADLVGDPHGAIPSGCATVATGPLLFNPCAFAAPRGLTFGNAGRNLLHMPRTTNFNMSLLKQFKINETTGFEFRAEAFNIFNHTQWTGSSAGGVNINNDFSTTGTFLHPSGARRARTLQFGLKFLF